MMSFFCKEHIFTSFYLLVAILCHSCKDMQDECPDSVPDEAVFVTTSGNPTDRSSARSARLLTGGIVSQGNMTVRVEETDWEECAFGNLATRSEVTGNEVAWESTPSLGVYITDATTDDNALVARNLAINPVTHDFYAKYYRGSADDTPQAITKSSFFWDADWNGKTSLPTSVNFYGYYPRPHNNDINQSALNYQKTSILSQEDAAGMNTGRNWWLLHYSFADQTDNNMSWHDVMYALSEPDGTGGRYGNQDKTSGNSVQLHFVHAFSLLDIEVSRGEKYQGDCEISSMELSGSQVFTEGDLDIVNGKITPSDETGAASLKRTFKATKITKDKNFCKTMIVQPTQDGDTPSGDGRLVLTCRIDGVNYSCSFPNLRLVGGKKYKLKLTLNPSGIVVFRIWNGAKVTIGGQTYSPDDSDNEMTMVADEFTVTPDDGYKVVDILRNGVSIFQSGQSTYELEKSDDANTYYNVVACPKEEGEEPKWYVTDGLQMHFDGIRNSYKYGTQDGKSGVWYDLSGNDNNGTLRSFTNASGWDGKGLKFDGLDDVVYFSGKINQSYTMEMYVCVEPSQRGAHPRFTAEGNVYPCFYFYGTGQSYDGTHVSTSNIRNLAFYDVPNKSLGTDIITNGSDIIQLDFAYDAETGILRWYVNGTGDNSRAGVAIPQSIPTASIGNKISDNSRALAGTYYSFMIYTRALSPEEVATNYKVNVDRYGQTKE